MGGVAVGGVAVGAQAVRDDMELQEFREKVTTWASKIDDIRAVFLFGSRAKGTFREDSDWDICCLIDAKPNEGWYGIWIVEADEWKEQFCEATGLSPTTVQFTAPTSNQVIDGLFECTRVLYLREDPKVSLSEGVE